MGPRKALGRGLGALLPGAEGAAGATEVPLDAIAPAPHQPRQRFDQARLEELAASIRAHGILSPVILRQGRDGYELVAGERRVRAARLAGLAAVPAVIREASSARALELALVENIQREDLNPVEEAEAYRRLIDEFGLTQEEMARRVGRDRTSIANALRLLRLPRKVREDLQVGTLTEGHARALLGLEKAADQLRARDRIVRGGLSVRGAEALVRRMRGREGPRPSGRGAGRSPDLVALEEELQRALGTRVRIRRRGRRGTLEIAFTSDADLERICERIGVGG